MVWGTRIHVANSDNVRSENDVSAHGYSLITRARTSSPFNYVPILCCESEREREGDVDGEGVTKTTSQITILSHSMH